MINFFLQTWHRASVCLYGNPRGITGEGTGTPKGLFKVKHNQDRTKPGQSESMTGGLSRDRC